MKFSILVIWYCLWNFQSCIVLVVILFNISMYMFEFNFYLFNIRRRLIVNYCHFWYLGLWTFEVFTVALYCLEFCSLLVCLYLFSTEIIYILFSINYILRITDQNKIELCWKRIHINFSSDLIIFLSEVLNRLEVSNTVQLHVHLLYWFLEYTCLILIWHSTQSRSRSRSKR